MTTNTRESGFEDAIESCMIEYGGYVKGSSSDYNRELALFPDTIFRFFEDTQPDKWQRLVTYHGAEVEKKVMQRLVRELSQRGTLDVLRHGINDYGVNLKLAYFAPASGLNPETIELYKKNVLNVTRQVYYSLRNQNSLDMVISVNGLPVATLELKNPLSGQTVNNAMRQYREDRDPSEILFQFKARTLVHFAVDPDEVYMTTRLSGEKTFFLPFNKGNGTGAGNPPSQHGYKTGYLWEEVLYKDSLMDILGRFLHVQVEEKVTDGRTVKKESLIFPRYHQLDAVRSVENDVKQQGAGHNYLIQHSAGSGKSNSIAWTAHRLANVHNAADETIFDSVIVITDRRVLDKQLQDTIYQFEHKQGVVKKIDDNSDQLATALNGGTRIIISTLQKFRYILDKVGDMPGKKFAVIIDEAHSSQSGESAGALRDVLSAKDLDEATRIQEQLDEQAGDTEEEIVRQLIRRGKKDNVSFFAFTATPKAKTLELFGRTNPVTGKPEPFHLYSMRQAIEERFIHDVLKNYMTYATYYKVAKTVDEDPIVDKKKATRAIARFVSFHPHNLAQKTEVMIDHFRRRTRHEIGGRAKAMLVTSSREHAVRYKFEFDRYIKEKGYTDMKTLVAFSGGVKIDEEEFTEVGINGIGEKELPEKFNTDDYQVLIVADKYQTGFDQPLLHTMFVDKRLSGIKAVQTLSRLNRTCPGKDGTFILDFVNKAEEIQASFQPYYEQSTIEEPTSPNMVYDLKSKLDGSQIYWESEVNGFSDIFFSKRQKTSSQGMLNHFLDPAVDRFKQKPEEEQLDFKSTLISYVRLYAFILQIAPFQDVGLHKLFVYGQNLLRKLPRREDGGKIALDDEVILHYYRLENKGLNSITLKDGEEAPLYGATQAGTSRGRTEEETLLSQIIQILNQRFGTEFTPADQLFFDQLEQEMVQDEELSEQARNNSMDNFKFVFDEKFLGKLIDRMELNQDMFARIMDDEKFQSAVKSHLLKSVYDKIRNLG
jgi:type I restriction enzyme R subunit